MSRAILSVLGTAQDGGLPHPNCFCVNCLEAMENPGYSRSAASLAIIFPDKKEWHLMDATPDIKEQVMRLQLRYGLKGMLMNSIFLTHAHMGHFPGLLFLGKEAMNTKELPVFVGEKMHDLLHNNAPWTQLIKLGNILPKVITNEKPVPITDNISIRPILVPHRNEFSETFGFWINGQSKKVLYIPDIDRWEEWEVDIFDACKRADICLIDGTFYSQGDLKHIDRNFKEIPHPLMTTTMEMLQNLTSKTKIYFTHLNHSNPAIDPDGWARKEIEKRGFFVAEEGHEFEL